MRAARLLQILLLLQNRGRQTSSQLALELEVSQRTILRDVDALTEAGLPIIVFQGNSGGIELGFNYRTRLTGLAADEAEALAIALARPVPELEALGVTHAFARARSKLLESFPDGVREKILLANQRFRFVASRKAPEDVRLVALCSAIRERRIVRIHAKTTAPRVVNPIGLMWENYGWSLIDALDSRPVQLAECGDINVSAKHF